MAEQILIHHFNGVPLHLTLNAGEEAIATGTGFLVKVSVGCLLVSNKHVFTGRHPETGADLDAKHRLPTRVHVQMHSAAGLGNWEEVELPLRDDGHSVVLLHPEKDVDVAAIHLVPSAAVVPHYLNATSSADVPANPSDPVSIVGFPQGFSPAGFLPIWKTGHIATEVQLPCRNLPCFMIDATTRPGMSGSPVVAMRNGAYVNSSGGLNFMQAGTSVIRFLGIYSGRISFLDDMHIGIVWQPPTITPLVEQAERLIKESQK